MEVPRSITLGTEHYGGQLQRLRNYVVNGTNYNVVPEYRTSLHKRILIKKAVDFESWVDLFYTSTIHIVGLGLGYEETDLWWLLTDRARFFIKRAHLIKTDELRKNRIIYYCPKEFEDQDKKELFNALGVETKFIGKKDAAYYLEVLSQIKETI